jgi:hypothetical protein
MGEGEHGAVAGGAVGPQRTNDRKEAGFAGTLTPWPPLPHALTPARERGDRLRIFWAGAPLSRVGGVRVGEGTGVRVPAKPAGWLWGGGLLGSRE